MRLSNNQQAFLALVRAGLWEKDVKVSHYGAIDYNEVYQLAEEQAVVGLVLAGLEYSDVPPPKELLLKWIGEVQKIEQRNKVMNRFVSELIDWLRKEELYCILVKGQGVAQCYERPLWRSAGDIDLLLSDNYYNRAKNVLIPFASEVANEDEVTKHQAMVINGIDVELHGKMPFVISNQVDKVIDAVLNDVLCGGNVRSWDCNGTQVDLPSPDIDVILVFTHYLHHFFIEGVGLRQICDWSRLLWSYRNSINIRLIEQRIRDMGLMSEWKVFASLAVDSLGMPVEAMPLYDVRFKVKGSKVLRRVLKSGNFGYNNDLSYRFKYSGFKYKMVSLERRFKEFLSLSFIFPLDAPRFFVTYVFNKAKK